MRSLYWSESGPNRGLPPTAGPETGDSQDDPPLLPGRSHEAERLRQRQPVAALPEACRFQPRLGELEDRQELGAGLAYLNS
jgi:hypothetical protein